MKYEQYMMEHGSDDYLPDIDQSSIVGRCAYCGEEIMTDDRFYSSDYDARGNDLYIHKECIGEYIREEYDDEYLAEVLGFEKQGG